MNILECFNMKNHIEFAKNNIIKSVDSLIEAYHIRMDPERRKQESLVIWNGLMEECKEIFS